MRFWFRALRGALEGAIGLAEAAGARGPRWHWRTEAWRRALEDRIAAWENTRRAVAARTRMCRSCRTLVPVGEAICPSCGASMAGVPSGGVGRLFAAVLPESRTVTVVLIGANVAMALAALVLTQQIGGDSGTHALLSPDGRILYLLGSKFTPAILAGGESWRLVTANYLHGGLLHLLLNMYSLSILGPLIEEAFGGRKLFVVYTVTGVCAFIVSAFASPHVRSVGASGALFGLMGFAIVYGRFRGGSMGRMISAQLMQWALLGVLMFFSNRIDSWAHAGGFGAGALLGLIVVPDEPRTRVGQIALRLVTAAAVLVTLGSFAAMAVAYPGNAEVVGLERVGADYQLQAKPKIAGCPNYQLPTV